MYIGKAFGQAGDSNAWQRTRRHETLQRIYEDHVGGPDIFVTPLRIHRADLHNVDHIDDDDPGFSLAPDTLNYFRDPFTGHPTVHAVDLIEHALIAYFVPPYNDKLVEWRSDQPTKPMRQMRSFGIRLLHIHLNGAGGLARFQSRQASRATRSHLILHDLPPEPRRPVLRGIGAARTASWRAKMVNVDDPEPVLSAGERAEFALNVFGGRAPRVRRPAAVDIEAIEDEYARMDRLRQDLQMLPKGEIPPPDQLFNEPDGTVLIGQSIYGEPVTWQLFDVEGYPRNGIIIGPAGYGKSNSLNIVSLGALQTGRLLLWAADGYQRHLETMRAWYRAREAGCLTIDWLACDLEEVHRQLVAACAIIEHRSASGSSPPDRDNAGILLTIEDAHKVFNTMPTLTHLAERVAVDGPANGVCLVVTSPDGNIARFGGSATLRRALGSANRIILGEEDALLAAEDFDEEIDH
ncbi:hypothetical protein ACQP2P_11275 [Dactylosporangium sp. CA-139114]|uniref:hypothetical protein n=1 Tax=Dactylosporangium sp. CA-139114 TaxID=3239931 RepID=UPI003D999AD4